MKFNPELKRTLSLSVTDCLIIDFLFDKYYDKWFTIDEFDIAQSLDIGKWSVYLSLKSLVKKGILDISEHSGYQITDRYFDAVALINHY